MLLQSAQRKFQSAERKFRARIISKSFVRAGNLIIYIFFHLAVGLVLDIVSKVFTCCASIHCHFQVYRALISWTPDDQNP
ncbi:hypothetical protein EJ04DRAFT_232904 [Polyplosphaeria fusca]|uniref:Uncharacterized protein n=1 Tax=Polyplosphaeria fusca TaxID=682080 RepID=A0A9P4R6D0_9PLEO|nr:hypothetical protein EJ04DRAFT_232904 [Polyplosphaeria fusca]